MPSFFSGNLLSANFQVWEIKLAMKFIPDLLTLTVCHCETHGLGCQLMDSQFQSNPRPAEKSVPSSTWGSIWTLSKSFSIQSP